MASLDRFELTDEHIALLRRAYVTWEGCEWGAPGVDCKRPYGNGDLFRDIHQILHPDDEWDDAYGLPRGLTPAEWESRRERYKRLHAETQTALQILLRQASIRTGVYETERYRSEWRLRDDSHDCAAESAADDKPGVVLVARCPEHGLHGQRTTCFVCGGPVEQVPMAVVGG